MFQRQKQELSLTLIFTVEAANMLNWVNAVAQEADI